MADEEPGRRVRYPTWNLVSGSGCAAVALGDLSDTWATATAGRPLVTALGVVIVAAWAWGVRARHRRPSWLLPRLYLLIAIPSGLALLVAGDLTAFGLGAIWLLIVPVTLSGEWLDHWLGAPRRSSSGWACREDSLR